MANELQGQDDSRSGIKRAVGSAVVAWDVSGPSRFVRLAFRPLGHLGSRPRVRLRLLHGYSFCKWRSGADEYKDLAESIPSLSDREKGVLLIVYSMGDAWAHGDMLGPASSLLANGYLARTYSGGLRGECYVMPGALREEIARRPLCQKALNDAEAIVLSWGYSVSKR